MNCTVDFYLLPDDQLSSLQNYACKLARQAWLKRQRVLIQTGSKDISQAIDEALWCGEKLSFIPHAIRCDSETDNEQQAILINHHETAQGQFELLINLSDNAANIEQSTHIIELLNQQDERKQNGREHYKIYRQLNCKLSHHELDTSDL